MGSSRFVYLYLQPLTKTHPLKPSIHTLLEKCYDIKHLIHSLAPYVLMRDLLALCCERG